MSRKKKIPQKDIASENYERGYRLVKQHPLFSPLLARVLVIRRQGNLCPENGWAVITANGYLHVHPSRRGEPHEWAYVIAHCLLHLGLGHFQEQKDYGKWNTACDCFTAKFLADLKLGPPPADLRQRIEFSAPSEKQLYLDFLEKGVPDNLSGFGTAGQGNIDMILASPKAGGLKRRIDWPAFLARGLSMAVAGAVKVAAGYEPCLGSESESVTPAMKARNWFINSFPLLGALAATFKIVEDPAVCARLDISTAAVSVDMDEIYINPAAGLDDQECRFVIAHELLHVGLRHSARRQGREPYLWNVACDYVINSWLVDMGLGEIPKVGGLYDRELKGLSAEAIYDRIAGDMRTFRKLATLRGTGLGDILEKGAPAWNTRGDEISLDDFYRSCLSHELVYHEEQGRGCLPAGLIEEIQALSQPPVPWDVELARWFDRYFLPLEMIRSYTRPSRRQASTPDIPRPGRVPALEAEDGRTFGVVLDTSGSMDRSLLAKALGAIASYSMARDVPLVRVIFCDAVAYDQGYLPPEAIADKVKVRGRGGTVLQPGIRLLEEAPDFPRDGPLLIITDGYCEPLRIHRKHAFLIPWGSSLPFMPRGKVFRFS